MYNKPPSTGGGFHAVKYTLKMARKSGNFAEFYRILRSKNTCKTCALGMQGMKNEIGDGFQVCKKAMQAVAQDLLSGINPEIFEEKSVSDLSKLSGRELENLGRLVEPIQLKEGDDHYRPVGWDEVYNILIDKLKNVDPKKLLLYTSGRSSNEAAFLIQLLGRQLGTNNINNCSYYCHQASGVGLKQTIGSGTATVKLEDVEKANLVVLIGANPSSNHPRFITHLTNLRKRGGKVIVVNPFKEVGLQHFKIPSKPTSLLLGMNSTVSDLYLQPHCGGDMAFLKAVSAYLWQEKLVTSEFIDKYCNNVDEYKKDLENTNVNELRKMAGIKKSEMTDFIDMLLSAENVIFSWAMGVTHQLHGVQTVRTLANLSLLLGQIGHPGRGLLPLRGHSNVQGVGTVGVVPKLPPKTVDAIAKNFKIKIPDGPGFDTFSAMEAANDTKIDLAIMLGGNLYAANPNSEWAGNALNKIDTIIYISTSLNLGHFYGTGKNTLIIPVRVRNEEKQKTTQESMFNYVRISDGGFDAPNDEIPTETELITKLGISLFANSPINWTELQDHYQIRQMISKTISGMEAIKDIDQTENTFTIGGRIYHEPKFSTTDGKANLFVGEPPDARPEKGTFNLTTFRSEGQFNTIVYEDADAYRGVKTRMVVFMNIDDMLDYKLINGNYVNVKSDVNEMRVQVARGPIKKGNVAMYFPEGNKLVPNTVDPQSRTPGFKRISVKISLADS